MTEKKWQFSGFYPFLNRDLPFILSEHYNQPWFEITKDVIGIILPYPHGFDSDPFIHKFGYCREFLHIFNVGKTRKNLTAVAQCVLYQTGLLPSMKRLVLTLG